MAVNTRLKVVLCWHMHQPHYLDHHDGEYRLPWTYLHGIKDYTDMAAHLEAAPQAAVVVNFSPTLLEQLDDYAQQVRSFLDADGKIRDPLLAALASPLLPTDDEGRLTLIKNCLRANEPRLIKRFPEYDHLAGMARWLIEHPPNLIYVSEQFLVDLVVWYHIAWLGEVLRRGNTVVQRMQRKAQDFTLHERRELLQIVGAELAGIIGRYRRLAERGQVELSFTPYAHPIMPLLLDLQSAREAMPEALMPVAEHYPGGAERVQWHIEKGLNVFERYFGFRPQGCWPSEGGVSAATLQACEQAGIRWVASGERVLHNSLAAGSEKPPACIQRPYRVQNGKIACFFRDDGLSDLVGFNYSEWHADDAVNNLIHHLKTIAELCKDEPNRVVSIILDGENAWEYYPENGYYFLHALYKKLSTHPDIEMTTFSRCLDAKLTPYVLPKLVSGSWVYGTFSTWIGDPDKNRAWDMLCDAKHRYDEVIEQGRLDNTKAEAAARQLAICEGSDWFWWFGDYNPGDSVRDFDYLFRMQLTNLYQLIGVEPPEYLSHVFAHGSGKMEKGGVMRRGSEAGS